MIAIPQKRIVRDPKTRRPLPQQGKRVRMSSYWRRRARSGDVRLVEGQPAKPHPRAQPKAQPKAENSVATTTEGGEQ